MPLRCPTQGVRPAWKAWGAAALLCSLCALPPHTLAQPSTPHTPARNATGPSAAASKVWRAPQARRMQYGVQGKYKGLPFQTRAQLDWLPQNGRYEAAQEVQLPLVGSRRQSSVGVLTPQGLQPEIFLDRSRKEHSTTFDHASRTLRFSRSTETAALPAATQDRVSVFFQLAGTLAAAPQRYAAGTRITIPTAGTRRVVPWTFVVRGKETLQLPAGRMSAIKLEHVNESNEDDLQTTLWLAPQLQYLPVRIRMLEEGGRDELDLTLQSHSTP